MNRLSKIIVLFCLVFSLAKMIHAQKQQFFGQQQTITKGRVWDVAFEDLNKDGQMDIVCENMIWLNKGNQQFNKYEAFEAEGRIIGLWLNDIDNDKDLDLFYSSSIPEKGLVLLKNKTKTM